MPLVGKKLRYKMIIMGVPIDVPAIVFGYNKSIVNVESISESSI